MKNKLRICLLLSGCILIPLSSCNKNNNNDAQDSDILAYTTLEKIIIPDAVPSTSPKLKAPEVSLFSQYGYGVWHYGAGLPYEKRLQHIFPLV